MRLHFPRIAFKTTLITLGACAFCGIAVADETISYRIPNPKDTVTLNRVQIFAADDGVSGVELWRSDGAAGAYRIADIRSGALGSYPREFAIFNNRVYFTADDGAHGPELWVTDGTPAGTYQVVDLIPGSDGSNPRFLTTFKSGICFRHLTPFMARSCGARTGHRRARPWLPTSFRDPQVRFRSR